MILCVARAISKEIASRGEDEDGRDEGWVLLQERSLPAWMLGGEVPPRRTPLRSHIAGAAAELLVGLEELGGSGSGLLLVGSAPLRCPTLPRAEPTLIPSSPRALVTAVPAASSPGGHWCWGWRQAAPALP